MPDGFNDPVDIYCERLDPSFWAEPLNAVSNLAFILAAVFAFRLYRKYDNGQRDIFVLIILAAIVGIGSFIFHTVATKGTSYADIFPIIFFIHFAVFVIFRRVMNLPVWQALVGLVLFVLFNIALLKVFGRAPLNGSMQYMGTFIILVAVSVYSKAKHHIVTREFLIASTAFALSITCRSLDMAICTQFPYGIHFMWHVLNGVTMFYVLKGLIKTASVKSI